MAYGDLLITSPVLRREQRRRGVTFPTRHPEYGYSIHANGGMVHRVREVAFGWKDGRIVQVAANWACSRWDGTLTARLLDNPGEMVTCERCDIEGTGHTQVVYVGAHPSGLIKVGCTNQLCVRMRNLNLKLLDFVPGGFDLERRLIAALGDPVQGREWFPAGVRDQALALLEEMA